MKHKLYLVPIIFLILTGCCSTQEELKEAVIKNRYQDVKDILDEDCNHNLDGLLDWCAYGGYLELAELLIEHGANVNEKGTWGQGRTPIYEAAKEGNTEIVELLIESKADLNIKCDYGKTVLHRTVFCIGGIMTEEAGYSKLSDCRKILALLIKNGADMNSQDDIGRTSLHLSVEYQNFQVTELLLKAGALTDIKDKEGNTAKEIAIKYKNEKILEIIKKYE